MNAGDGTAHLPEIIDSHFDVSALATPTPPTRIPLPPSTINHPLSTIQHPQLTLVYAVSFARFSFPGWD